MKLLKVENGCGHFLIDSGEYSQVDKITKEDILRLAKLTLEDEVEFDAYVEKAIHNHAHQIIYKSIFEKLRALKDRKKEFKDESERLFLKEYEKYRPHTSEPKAID
jgi:hypothetical protein